MDNKIELSPSSFDKGEKREIEYGLELPRGELATVENGATNVVIQLTRGRDEDIA